MAIPYDAFTEAFLAKTTGYDLYPLDAPTRQQTVDGFMKRACAKFKKICKYDIANGDDDAREFNIDVPEEDIDEIVDIVSAGMLSEWLAPHFYTIENLQNLINTKDFEQYSPAELLFRVQGAYSKCQKDFSKMMKEYSYNHGDLKVLHL